MQKYAIGLDYGTLSVRALLIDADTGEEVATSVYEYPHGVMETQLPSGKKLPSNFALQHPRDYIEGFIIVVKNVIAKAKVSAKEVIGIGVDFTSSTILPVKADKTPICFLPEFQDEPHAYVKLWKHHGGEVEAQMIDRIAKERGERWISFYGNKVSCEWMIPKILETLHHAPEVYQASDRYMEALDWVIWNLTDEEIRSGCAAGYKAFYRHDVGYPSNEFFKKLDGKLEHLVQDKLAAPVKNVGEVAGYLTDEMADAVGLIQGTPIGVGIVDAHASVVGSGINKPGTMMIIVGTSSCHMILSETEAGICGVPGIVKDGIIPGYFGYEAGQSCVGDCFSWFVQNYIPESYEKEAREKNIGIYQLLDEKLTGYKVGQSGLIALDWFNGVRTPLMDYNLSGMILGMNLLTKPEEIYLSLIEATAYGTRSIIETFEEAGVVVDSIVLSGGIPHKNKRLVQVYADVCNREIRIAKSRNASARGAAILGIAAASEQISGYKNINEIIEKLGEIDQEIYVPNSENAGIYDKLYKEYQILSEYFGTGINDVMKRLHEV